MTCTGTDECWCPKCVATLLKANDDYLQIWVQSAMRGETGDWVVVKCPKCNSDQCFPTHTEPPFMCVACGHEFDFYGTANE